MKPTEECVEVAIGDMTSQMDMVEGHLCECGLFISPAYAKFNGVTYEKWKYSSDQIEKVMKKYKVKEKEKKEKLATTLKEIKNKRKTIRSNDMETEKPKLIVKLLQGVEMVYDADEKAIRCPYDKDFLCSSKCVFFSSKETETFKVVKCRDFVMGQVKK